MHRLATFAPFLALLLLPGFQTTARVADKRSELDALLRQARQALEAGRFQEAKTLLLGKLAEHKGADYLEPKLEEIRATIKTCSFRSACPPKGLKDLLSGEVTAFDPKTGKIAIVYDRKAMESKTPRQAFPGGDVELVGEESRFRYPFAGEHSVVFKGKALSESCPLVRLCIVENKEVHDSFLFDLDRKGLTCLDHVVDEKVVSQASSTNMYNVTRPYVLKLVVRDAEIEALLDGKRVVVGDKPKKQFGFLSYRRVQNLERIEVAGRIDTTWVQQIVDERARTELLEFEKTYDPKADLPDWLR